MKNYEIVAVFWEDHMGGSRSTLPRNVDDLFETPSLSIGLLVQETEKSLLIVSDLEKYEEHLDATYMAILKSTVVAIKRLGSIELDEI